MYRKNDIENGVLIAGALERDQARVGVGFLAVLLAIATFASASRLLAQDDGFFDDPPGLQEPSRPLDHPDLIAPLELQNVREIPIPPRVDNLPQLQEHEVELLDDRTGEIRTLTPQFEEILTEIETSPGEAGACEILHPADVIPPDGGIPPDNVAQQGGGAGLQGADDRVKVGNTTSYPWRCIGKVYVWFDDPDDPNTPVYGGTGALVGPCHILTAGHIVYNRDASAGPIGWAKKLIFVPAMYRDSSGVVRWPYGSAQSIMKGTYKAWTDSGDFEHDWGFVALDKDLGNTTGWFGYCTGSNDGKIRNLAGYPGNRDGGNNQYFSFDVVDCENSNRGRYRMDATGGQSGAPVWRYNGVSRWIRLIHSASGFTCGGSGAWDQGVRITNGKFGWIQQWKEEYQCPQGNSDLVVAGTGALEGPRDLLPGSQFRLSLRLANLGTAAAIVPSVGVFLREDTDAGNNDVQIASVGPDQIGELGCFQPADVELDVVIPASAAVGARLVVIIDPENLIPELDDGNNTHDLGPVTLGDTFHFSPQVLGPTGGFVSGSAPVTVEAPLGSSSQAVEVGIHLESDVQSSRDGAQGWSFSVLTDPGFQVRAATVNQTIADVAPVGMRQNGFQRTSLVDPADPHNAGREGVTSAVVLSFNRPITLPPQGSELVLRLTGDVDTTGNSAAGDTTPFHGVRVLDSSEVGLKSGAQPVQTLVTLRGESAFATASSTSVVVTAVISPEFLRADANDDGAVDMSDAVFNLNFLFLGGPASTCMDASDANDSGAVDLSDTVFVLSHLFLGGSPPPPPFPACGVDPTRDSIGCALYLSCP